MNSPYFPIMFLLCHFWGDYILQSDWCAVNKSARTLPCLIHVILYTSCFLFLTFSWKALLFIGVTHFIIDRNPIIIRRLIWLKNHMGPKFKYVPFSVCQGTGYYDNLLNEISNIKPYKQNIGGYTPRINYITIWLFIITDNILHLTFNYIALKYLI